MMIPKEELLAVLGQFNPWWRGESVPEQPRWRRAAWRTLKTWLFDPPVHRALLLSGARQVGKTTLVLQSIEALLDRGVPAANILYVTFDHPILKLAGVDAVLEAWREREPRVPGPEYLFLDEAQFIRDWEVWMKHQVDFFKQTKIFFTGSATPLLTAGQESGVGRWHTVRLTTLSFFEYLQIRRETPPALPDVHSVRELFDWDQADFYRVGELAAPYVGLFHEYLVRGGFPQTARVEDVTTAQRLLREDIIDKILKRDMTVLFGVRNVLQLEQTFLYLCMHDGGILDMQALSKSLEVARSTAQNFIDLLEATHLIFRLPPYGYGKKILRARYKVYLADAAIASSVMLRGKAVLDDLTALGVATETSVIKHLFSRYYSEQIRFSYARTNKGHEVDLLAELGDRLVPFEVKYRSQPVQASELKGLLEIAESKKVDRGYVVTKSLRDFGPLESQRENKIMRVPAPLLCYWLGGSEVEPMQP